MFFRIVTLIVAALLTLPVRSQGVGAFEYGPRPPLAVFDPDGILRPESLKEISDPLTAIYEAEGIDVLVVVLTDLKEAPPEHVGRLFSRAWSKSEIHCLVLHVPGNEDSPWIMPAGKIVEVVHPDQIVRYVADAQRRAANAPNPPEQVRVAANEAVDMLRHWTRNVINHNERLRTERLEMRVTEEKEARWWRIGMALGAAAMIPLAGGIWLIVRFFRNRSPRYFPNRTRQNRLGAPHAGGNHAVVKIGPLPP